MKFLKQSEVKIYLVFLSLVFLVQMFFVRDIEKGVHFFTLLISTVISITVGIWIYRRSKQKVVTACWLTLAIFFSNFRGMFMILVAIVNATN